MIRVITKARKERTIESCIDCPNIIGGWSGWGLVCDKTGREIVADKRYIPEWCPLPENK